MNLTFMIVFGIVFGILATALFSRAVMAWHPYWCGVMISFATLLGAFIGMSLP